MGSIQLSDLQRGRHSLPAPRRECLYDHKHGEAFGALSLLTTEEEILPNPWDRLKGGDWWDAARGAGASIPEHVGRKTHESEPVALLPQSVRDPSHAISRWDW